MEMKRSADGQRMIDLHCHILPGLDDGAKSLEEAVEMARIAQDEGIERIVVTPHLFRENILYEDLGRIEEKRKELHRALETSNIHVELLSGAEVHISHNLMEEIRKNRKHLVVNRSSYMFVEFPSRHVFSGVKELFFELMSEGIIPIIAHPERNSVFVRNPSFLYELIQMGSLAQANSGSLSGIYGRGAEQAVSRFLEMNLIHFIASDGHNTSDLAPKLSGARERAERIIGKEGAIALVEDNPAAVLEDKEIPYLPEAVNPSREERRLPLKISLFKRRD
jgi:protein-tyrosine phosphatase